MPRGSCHTSLSPLRTQREQTGHPAPTWAVRIPQGSLLLAVVGLPCILVALFLCPAGGSHQQEINRLLLRVAACPYSHTRAFGAPGSHGV